MTDTVDLLQIKIEKAKANLPEETLNAISAVDWKAAILGMRQSKGYNFEQLGDLEIETELVLCGLLSPEDYPKEIEKRMGISKMAASELVNEMNMLVFKKIKEELIKNSERKKIFANRTNEQRTSTPARVEIPPQATIPLEVGISKKDTEVLKSAGIEVVPARNASSIADAGGKLAGISVEASVKKDMPIEKKEDILKKMENPDLINKEKTVHPLLEQKILSAVQTPVIKTEHSPETISAMKNDTDTKKSYAKNTDPYRLSPDE